MTRLKQLLQMPSDFSVTTFLPVMTLILVILLSLLVIVPKEQPSYQAHCAYNKQQATCVITPLMLPSELTPESSFDSGVSDEMKAFLKAAGKLLLY